MRILFADYRNEVQSAFMDSESLRDSRFDVTFLLQRMHRKNKVPI